MCVQGVMRFGTCGRSIDTLIRPQTQTPTPPPTPPLTHAQAQKKALDAQEKAVKDAVEASIALRKHEMVGGMFDVGLTCGVCACVSLID